MNKKRGDWSTKKRDWEPLKPQIETMISQGSSIPTIATELKVSETCLRQTIKEWGLKTAWSRGVEGVTEDELTLIKQWKDEGISLGQIALRIKRHKKTIYEACIAHGIDVTFADERSRPWREDELQRLREMREQGMRYRDIALALHRGINTVKQKLKDMDLESPWCKKLAVNRQLAQDGKKRCYVCEEVRPLEEFLSNHKYCNHCIETVRDRVTDRLKDNTDLDRMLNARLSNARERTKMKGLAMDIDIEYLRELYAKQEGRCFYTNDQLSLATTNQRTLSIDRIDSSRGYIKGNIALCIKQVNMCKLDMSLNEFKTLIDKTYHHLFKDRTGDSLSN